MSFSHQTPKPLRRVEPLLPPNTCKSFQRPRKAFCDTVPSLHLLLSLGKAKSLLWEALVLRGSPRSAGKLTPVPRPPRHLHLSFLAGQTPLPGTEVHILPH